EKSPAGTAVFDKARELYAGPMREKLTYQYKHAGEYADEPIFAAALGLLGIPPHESPPMHRLQVTTPNIVDGAIDLDLGELQAVKQPAGGPPQVWSGAICHFCGLAPMETYFELADSLRTRAGLPTMNRALFNPIVLTASHHRETVGH
ncbi:MAG: hypothetical protein KDE14_15430, partial [Rhodobacteraceae bacterium]|nr:hypothetical protein [Paracoccaceae bacterium]